MSVELESSKAKSGACSVSVCVFECACISECACVSEWAIASDICGRDCRGNLVCLAWAALATVKEAVRQTRTAFESDFFIFSVFIYSDNKM